MKHLNILFLICLAVLNACDDGVALNYNHLGEHFDAYCDMSGGQVAAYVDSNGNAVIVDSIVSHDKLTSYNYKYGICKCGPSYYCIDSGCDKDNNCNHVERTLCTDGDTRCINQTNDITGVSVGVKQKCNAGLWVDVNASDLQACQDSYGKCQGKLKECKDDSCRRHYLCDTDYEICKLKYESCKDTSCTYSEKHQFDICGECANYSMRCKAAYVEQCQNGHYEVVQDCTNLNGCAEFGDRPELDRVPHCVRCDNETSSCALDENGNGIKMVCANHNTKYDGKCENDNSCIFDNATSRCGSCHNGNTVCRKFLDFDDKIMSEQKLYIKASCENGQYAFSDENISMDAALQSPDLLFYDTDTCIAPVKDSLCITYNGNAYMYQNNGSAYSFLRPCPYGCLNDACNDIKTDNPSLCTDSEYRCSETNELQECVDGAWSSREIEYCKDKCEQCIEMMKQCQNKSEDAFICADSLSYQCVKKDRIEPDFENVEVCENGQVCTEDKNRCTDFCTDKEDGLYCYGDRMVECSGNHVINQYTIKNECNEIAGKAYVCGADSLGKIAGPCKPGCYNNGTQCGCTAADNYCLDGDIVACDDKGVPQIYQCIQGTTCDDCYIEKCSTSSKYLKWDNDSNTLTESKPCDFSCTTENKCGECVNNEYKCEGKSLMRCDNGVWKNLDKEQGCKEPIPKACIKAYDDKYTLRECIQCDSDFKCQLEEIEGTITKDNVLCRRSPQDRSVDAKNCEQTETNCFGGKGYYINECQTNLVNSEHGYDELKSYMLKGNEPAQGLETIKKTTHVKIKSIVPKNNSNSSKEWYQIQLEGVDSTCFIPVNSATIDADVTVGGFMYSSGSTDNYCMGYRDWACKAYLGTDSAPQQFVGTEGDAALSVANILNALKKDTYTPLDVYSELSKSYLPTLGNVPIDKIADYLNSKKFNVDRKIIEKKSQEAARKEMIEVFMKGGFVLALQNEGYWATHDMYITVYGITSDGNSIFADDPMNRRYRQDSFKDFYNQNHSLLAITNK